MAMKRCGCCYRRGVFGFLWYSRMACWLCKDSHRCVTRQRRWIVERMEALR